mmetsp:Transcript_35963/g.73939  ORF Transcript_35963/g.73939 Transcript_35963/m.73939 type:complete len:174 (+) Transcript_35963:73-594(+)
MAAEGTSIWNMCCQPRTVTVMEPANDPALQWTKNGNYLVPKSGQSPKTGVVPSPRPQTGSSSGLLSPKATVVENHTTDSLVGVGIVFESTKPGQTGLVVASLASGGSAMRSAQIDPGDELVGVDGKDVGGMGPAQMAPLILGKQGSRVTMVFRAKDSDKQKTVQLTRSYIMRR